MATNKTSTAKKRSATKPEANRLMQLHTDISQQAFNRLDTLMKRYNLSGQDVIEQLLDNAFQEESRDTQHTVFDYLGSEPCLQMIRLAKHHGLSEQSLLEQLLREANDHEMNQPDWDTPDRIKYLRA